MPTLKANEWFFSGGLSTTSPLLNDGSQRLVNMYPQSLSGPGQKTPVSLISRPGLTTPLLTLANSPVRAILIYAARGFAVGGTHFYEFNPVSGAIVTDYGVMGASTGVGPCQIVTNGTQFLVMDWSIGKIYNANTTGPAMDFVLDGKSLEFLDGFFFALQTGTNGRIRQSAFGDGTSWPALDYVDTTATSDVKTRLLSLNRELWVFGKSNTEVWRNAGTAGFTLTLSQVITQGVSSGDANLGDFSVVRAGNTAYWLGMSQERGGLSFFRADGYTPVHISDAGVDNLLLPYCYGDISNPSAFTEEVNGQVFVVWNFGNATSFAFVPEVSRSAIGTTLVFGVSSGYWHERAYKTSGGAYTRALPSCSAAIVASSTFFGTTTAVQLVGDYSSGKIYFQSSNATDDFGQPIACLRITPHVGDKQQRWRHVKLLVDLVAPLASLTPKISWTDSSGADWTTYENLQVYATSGSVPRYGKFQLGMSQDRIYRFYAEVSGIYGMEISNAWIDVQQGTDQ